LTSCVCPLKTEAQLLRSRGAIKQIVLPNCKKRFIGLGSGVFGS
jgi:hypothetical protein